jgi:hypothetical protein
MTELLKNSDNLQKEGGHATSQALLDGYTDQVIVTHTEWCRQQGNFQADSRRPQLLHIVKDNHSSINDVIGFVLQA